MTLDLFAGQPVSDYERSLAWYEQLLGTPPSFIPNPTEAVWEMNEHGYLYVVVAPEHAGGGHVTAFVDDFDARLAAIADRGLEPEHQETYENGVRKAIFRDPDGNEVGFGGGPADPEE